MTGFGDPKMPGSELKTVEDLMQELDDALVRRVGFMEGREMAGEQSTEDSLRIAELDREIEEVLKKVCGFSRNQTPEGLLAVALRQLVRREKIQQEKADVILKTFEDQFGRSR